MAELRRAVGLVLVAVLAAAGEAAEADLPRPTESQAAWQDLELGIFFHFSINTFHSKEWSDGTLDPATFDPKELDAGQWVGSAKKAGARYVVLTAKHHDGFCLWPTRTTEYSVKFSPWKRGRGDVVREVAGACAREGMQLGLYLSPWDRHEPTYSDPKAYDDFYARQMEELLTGYGPLVEVWLDGAGSDGRTYDWPRIMALIRKHQPKAMVFNMGEPTIRWSGNEAGYAPEPCWNVVRKEDVPKFAAGRVKSDGSGSVWLPVECDVSIRQGWFWSPGSEGTLKSLAELLTIYQRSVGRGANLLLNVAPDSRGLLPDADVARLLELGSKIRERFGKPLARTSGSGAEVELDLKEARAVDHVAIAEDLSGGERIRRYLLEAYSEGEWRRVASGTAVGHRRLHALEPLRAERIRLRVLESAAPPQVRELAAFSALPFNMHPELYRLLRGVLDGGSRPKPHDLEALNKAIDQFPAYAPLHVLRAQMLEDDRPQEALADFDLLIALEPGNLPARHVRAGVLFQLERFKEAIADYDAAIAGGRPHDEDSCWERGLAYYYAGDFDGGRRQFEGYHRVGALDIENGLWRFLCIAEREGIDKAKQTLLAYPDKRRKPFPALLALYSGSGTPEQVLREAAEVALASGDGEEALFYAHYYIGKHFEILRQPGKAAESISEALKHPVRHFMYWCAKIDLKRVEKPTSK